MLKKKTDVLHISPNPQVGKLLHENKNINYVCGAVTPDVFYELNAVFVDVTKIGFEADRFDVVICNHVLEHVTEDRQAFQEIYRVLKPSGYAILQVPLALNLEKTLEVATLSTGEERKKAYGQGDHLRLYGLDYFAKLSKVGFRVVRDNPFKNHWTDDLERHHLDVREDVIVAYKK